MIRAAAGLRTDRAGTPTNAVSSVWQESRKHSLLTNGARTTGRSHAEQEPERQPGIMLPNTEHATTYSCKQPNSKPGLNQVSRSNDLQTIQGTMCLKPQVKWHLMWGFCRTTMRLLQISCKGKKREKQKQNPQIGRQVTPSTARCLLHCDLIWTVKNWRLSKTGQHLMPPKHCSSAGVTMHPDYFKSVFFRAQWTVKGSHVSPKSVPKVFCAQGSNGAQRQQAAVSQQLQGVGNRHPRPLCGSTWI